MDDELRKMARDVIELNGGHGEIERKAIVLARTWLAEHPADDGEPIDAAWLESVGFEKGNQHVNSDVLKAYFYNPIHLRWYVICTEVDSGRETRGFSLGTRYSIDLENRGEVRRLCAALGAPLVERALATAE